MAGIIKSLGLGIAVLAGIIVLFIPFAGNPFWTGLVAQVLIFGLLALSVDLLMRHTGLFPMCNGAFFAVAAYTVATLEVTHGWSSPMAALAGIAAAGITGAIFGVSVRAGGVYFILVTLALGQIVWGVSVQWTWLTGGDNGITNVPYPSIGGAEIESLDGMYYFVAIAVVLATVLYRQIIRSPFGLSLNGIRDSESRMTALGFNVTLRKYAAFVISSLFAGVAGVLYAYTNQFVSPATASLLISVEAALMPILGGAGTVLGAFIGAVVIIGIRNVISAFVYGWPIVMGLVFIVVVLFAPKGILGVYYRLSRQPDPANRKSIRPELAE
ncbi:MAG: branched-chain amino acid ABC transporter permease [Pseudomonadota bacterium]